MQALLDAVGSVVVGGMVLVTIITALSNVQAYSYNINIQLTLNKISESITSVLDDRYLSSLATFSPTSSPPVSKENAILNASRTRLRFWGEIDGAISRIDIRVGAQDAQTGWWPLTVEIEGNLDFGEFFISQQNVFTYFDENSNQMAFSGNTIPGSQTDKIHSVKLDLAYVLTGMADNSGVSQNIHNKIIFWKFFKNLYIE